MMATRTRTTVKKGGERGRSATVTTATGRLVRSLLDSNSVLHSVCLEHRRSKVGAGRRRGGKEKCEKRTVGGSDHVVDARDCEEEGR
jgi:hypothetical protein